ncbi:24382_t:CDS:2, partial [Gigaspora rosea]
FSKTTKIGLINRTDRTLEASVENLNNHSDIKTIRVMIEVVAHQNLKRGINMPLSNNHVFNIYEDCPLEFMFKTNLDYDDSTEIVFSTLRISAKLFKILTVEPESNVRVYICFRPLPS